MDVALAADRRAVSQALGHLLDHLGQAVEAEQGGEHREYRQERDVLIEVHVAGSRAQGEDDQDFEQRQLAHPTPSGKAQEGEDQDEGA
ncbi:hypothetical protein FQZ97_1058820 [compost metagenome]